MKKILYIINAFIALFTNLDIRASIITTLNKNDPAPLFSSAFPYNYLSQNEKEYLKERTDFCFPQWISLQASAFYQSASQGKNINGRDAELGDLTGRWNMIAVLPFASPKHHDIPEGQEPFPGLEKIRDNLIACNDVALGHTNGKGVPEELKTVPGLLSLQDQEELFGFFSVPMKYRKAGVRFEFDARIYKDFGFSAQIGVADISQLKRFVDLTGTPTQCIPQPCLKNCDDTKTLPPICCLNPFDTKMVTNEEWCNVVHCTHVQLMDKLQRIADEVGIDLCDYNKTSFEDLHFEFWWRHMFNIKPEEPQLCWFPFLFVPFVSLGADIGTGKAALVNNPISLPFGNNGHSAIRGNLGCSLDFYDTIEIGGHVGVTHFFDKKFCGFRIPTNDFQNGIIPYKTNVEIKPGQTWHVGIFMNAFRFLDCFSAWAEYLYVSHLRDKITICANNSNGAFKPDVLECKSPWNSQFFNGGLNLDVSPNFTIGFAIQIPLKQRNAYKSTTYMLSLLMTF